METGYFKGEVSPHGWAKVPAYPLCGCAKKAYVIGLTSELIPYNIRNYQSRQPENRRLDTIS
jgi:hypothetical protein